MYYLLISTHAHVRVPDIGRAYVFGVKHEIYGRIRQSIVGHTTAK